MHLRSKRVVLKPKLSCLSTAPSTRTSDANKAHFPVEPQSVSHPCVLPEREKKLPSNGPPSTVDRMIRTLDANPKTNSSLPATMDAPSAFRCRNGKRIMNLMSKNAVNGTRKVRLKPIEKRRKNFDLEKKILGIQNNISTNDWSRNRRSTRLHVQTEELLRNGGSMEETVHRNQKENHGRTGQMESVDGKTVQYMSLSTGVTTRHKAGLVVHAEMTSGEKKPTAKPKVGFSKSYVSSVKDDKVRLPWVLRSGKAVKKVQCRPLNSVLQNKMNVMSTSSNVKLRRHIKDSFYNMGKKACFSGKYFRFRKNVDDRAPYDQCRAEVPVTTMNIGNPVFRETNKSPKEFERNDSELLKSSESPCNDSSENAKDDKPCPLYNIGLKSDEQQSNTEGATAIPAPRKRKRVSENVEKRSRFGIGATLSSSVEKQHFDKEKGALGAGVNDSNTTVLDVLDSNVDRGSLSCRNSVRESDFVAEIAGDCSFSDPRNVKFEPASKWCLLAADPTETGGRQMRPRPLCLEQPLIVLVEGKDQDYLEFDGGMFYQMLQQAEQKVVSVDTRKISKKAPKISRDLTARTFQSISVPSFRSIMEFEGTICKRSPVYRLPKSYIKEIPQVLSCTQAEYDIDEVDEEWLYRYNQSVPASFSISVDQLEKIIDLLDNSMSDSIDLFSEFLDSTGKGFEEYEECCICNGGENSADNLILCCAGCHISVHLSCYGIQNSEAGQGEKNWRCRKCEAVAKGLEKPDISCILCCQQGGALKRATEPHKWAHVTCALYTNETYFIDTDAMEPIEGVDAACARAKRQKRNCCLCGKKKGCVEKCSAQGCKETFHVSCGVNHGASFELLHSNEHVTAVLIYCPKHASGMERGSKTAPSPSDHDRCGKVQGADRICIRKARSGKALNRKNANGNAAIHVDGFDGEDYGSKNLVEGIVLHWLSRRFEHRGPLLHHIQQKHAVKQFNIFNPVDGEVGETYLKSQEKDLREMGFNERISMVLNWLSEVQRLSDLVVSRERLKLDLYLTDQGIIETNIQALKAGETVRLCSACSKPRLSLICTACNRSTCFFCVKANGSSRWQSWLNSLKQPNYLCSDCLGGASKAHREASYSSPAALCYGDDSVAGSKRSRFSADANNCKDGILSVYYYPEQTVFIKIDK